jgi:hypothetical protein
MNRILACVACAALALVCTAVPATAANLLANPGFENPVLVSGDTFGAVGWNVFGGGTFTIKLAPHSGDNAFKTFGQTSGAFQDFPAAPAQLWQGSAWVLNPSFDAMAGAQIATANIEWRDSGGNLISFLPSAPPITAATPQGNNAAGYTQVNVAGLAPPGTATARFVLLTGAFAGPGGGAPFFDDASFELVPEPVGIATAAIAAMCLSVCVRRRKPVVGV